MTLFSYELPKSANTRYRQLPPRTRRQPECVIYPPTDDVQGVKECQADQQLKRKMPCCKPNEMQLKRNRKETANQLKSNCNENAMLQDN